MTINEKNFYEKGMLLVFKAGSYSGAKRMSKDQLEEKEFPTEIVRGVFDLFDKEYKKKIQAVNKLATDMRSHIKDKSVPFPIDGVYFIMADKLEEIMKEIEIKVLEKEKIVQDLANDYEQAIERYKKKYPKYYTLGHAKYPSKKEFTKRFYWDHQLIQINAPSKNSFISPEMYKKELQKFKETIDSIKQEVTATIYEELLIFTKRLRSQCKDKTPNQRTLNNLNKFLEKVDGTYSEFIDRKDIQKILKDIKQEVLGVSAKELRNTEDLKKDFRKSMGKVLKSIKALPDIPKKRALDF
jgi:hypothetical protein